MTTTTARKPFYEAYGGTAPEAYERYFVPAIGGPLAHDLIAEAGLRAGERVLDVACGTGVVARLAAERVGAGGSVAALDLNAAMLDVARTVPAPDAPAIRWYESPAESMPLPDGAFDVVLCQLGLQFIENRAAALREMHRVTARGGRVLVSVPTPTEFWGVLDAASAHRVPGAAGAGTVRATSSMAAFRSSAATVPPAPTRSAASRATTPVPHATSSTRSPARSAASAIRSCASGPPIVGTK